MQISTGVSQWDVPTQAAPTVPTPGATPQQTTDPYAQPPSKQTESGLGDEGSSTRGVGGGAEPYGGAERSGGLGVRPPFYSFEMDAKSRQSADECIC